jgi:ferredoxin-NADP reductase
MLLRIRRIDYLAEGIHGFELVDPRGRDLPRFAAGAHVELRLAGMMRQYSLCNDPGERRRYCLAVLREGEGRGFSQRLHDRLRVGDQIEVSVPRNNFPLAEVAERHLLLAGGIGIAPIMAMLHELRRRGAEFQLDYCTRSPGHTAFREALAPFAAAGRVAFHHDGGDPARGLDIAAALRDPAAGTHLYYCGPAPMMLAAAAAAHEWPSGTVHCEYFTAPEQEPASSADDRPFRVRLGKSGGEYEVPPGMTIIEVLRAAGIAVATSCELGYCGVCLTRYVAGEPEHRDQMLSDKDREHYALICCARAKTPVLELDL